MEKNHSENSLVRSDYDSDEEMYFHWFLLELKNKGYVEHINLNPQSFDLAAPAKFSISIIKKLKTKTKIIEKEAKLVSGKSYTPDFEIIWSEKAKGIFIGNEEEFLSEKVLFYANKRLYSCIEVKPLFNMHNMVRLFETNQAWVYSKHGIFVQKVIPQVLFKKSFTPQRYFLTNGAKKERKINWQPISLDNYLNKQL